MADSPFVANFDGRKNDGSIFTYFYCLAPFNLLKNWKVHHLVPQFLTTAFILLSCNAREGREKFPVEYSQSNWATFRQSCLGFFTLTHLQNSQQVHFGGGLGQLQGHRNYSEVHFVITMYLKRNCSFTVFFKLTNSDWVATKLSGDKHRFGRGVKTRWEETLPCQRHIYHFYQLFVVNF